MHHPLPRKVRRAISNITQQVSHETKWGSFTLKAAAFPGECRWRVTGGHDWPLKDMEVSVTAVCGDRGLTEVRVVGFGVVKAAFEKFCDEEAGNSADADISNKRHALEEVLAALKVAA